MDGIRDQRTDVRHGESVLWRIRDQPPACRANGLEAAPVGGERSGDCVETSKRQQVTTLNVEALRPLKARQKTEVRRQRSDGRGISLKGHPPAVDSLLHYVQISWRLWPVAAAAHQRMRIRVRRVAGHGRIIEVIAILNQKEVNSIRA